MNKYYWIPANGDPQVIESDLNINKLWHQLMNDPDSDLCFETVCMNKSREPFDNLIMMVDECGKLKDHYFNVFATAFYLGGDFGDYIAGDVLVCKMILVPYEEDGKILFYEHDLGSLSDSDLEYLQSEYCAFFVGGE